MTQTFTFPGGLHPPQHKYLSNQTKIVVAPLPQRVVLPLAQHIGAPAKPLVKVGERVLRGQKIARAEGYISAPIHASISGHVVAITEHPIAHPSGLKGECIIIESDGLDEAAPTLEHYAGQDISQVDPSHLRNLVREAGIVGLGGAAFPSFVKLNPGPQNQVETLILNGAECEPYITCDDRLMREYADNVIAGIEIIMHALGAKQCLIGIEDNKPEARSAMHSALQSSGRTDTNIIVTPTIYPEGGEKQLIKVLTDKEVPAGGLPLEVGVVCQNVGTAAAIYQAVHNGQPLVSRIVTVTGRGVEKQLNVEARIGTPVAELVAFAGGYTHEAERLIMGGPMMGFGLQTDEIPLVKATNCLLVTTADEVKPSTEDAMPCIRCGSCAEVCPVNLVPQQMYWYAKSKDFDKIQEYNLFDCIECGCCAHVCPSHIPLVQYYRFAKSEIWQQEKDKKKANAAKERHEARQTRIDREAAEKAKRAEERKAAMGTDASSQKAAVQAAMARSAAKKAASKGAAASAGVSTPTNTDEAKPIGAAAIAIAAAKARAAATKTEQAGRPPAETPALAAIAKAKAAKADQGPESSEHKMSTAQAAIAKAKAEKQQNTDSAEPRISAAQAAIAKAKAAKAAQSTDNDEPKMSAAQIAIAKAKAAKAAQRTDSTEPELSAAQAAIAKTAQKTDDAAPKMSAARTAIAKAKAAKAAQQANDQGES
jgi:electron transport complex protein RnfC